jgi:hypothetical protein
MALTAALSPSSLPQSSTGRFEVSRVRTRHFLPSRDADNSWIIGYPDASETRLHGLVIGNGPLVADRQLMTLINIHSHF